MLELAPGAPVIWRKWCSVKPVATNCCAISGVIACSARLGFLGRFDSFFRLCFRFPILIKYSVFRAMDTLVPWLGYLL